MDDFFAELDRRMNDQDDDLDEYIRSRRAASLEIPERAGASPEDIFFSQVNGPQNPRRDTCRPPQREHGSRQHNRRSGQQLNLRRHNRSLVPYAETKDEKSNTSLPDPFSTTCAVTDRATVSHQDTEEHSIPKHIDCSLHEFVSDSPIPDPNTSRITARGNGVFVKNSSEFIHGPIETLISQRANSGTNGDDSVPDSTGPAQPSQISQNTDPAVLENGRIYGSSSPHAYTHGNVVRQSKRRKTDAPPISTPDNYSDMDAVQPQPAPSRHTTDVSSSTTSHDHRKDGVVQKSPHLSPANDIRSMAPITGTSPRVAGSPVPRSLAGFNIPARANTSNITSPGATPSRQPCDASRSPAPSTEVQPSSSNFLAPKKSKARKTVSSNRASRKVSGKKSSSKQTKDKPKLFTPLEYAQKLQSHIDPAKFKTNYLKGKRIFYVGGDMMYASPTTRGRMEYIVKHGGTLVPKYDPAVVTHIVTDAGIRHTLEALSLKSLSDISDHIPTVTWNWVVSGYGRTRKRKLKSTPEGGDSGSEDDPLDFEFMHAAFSERIDAGRKWKNIHRAESSRRFVLRMDDPNNRNSDISNISNFSQERTPRNKGTPLTVLPPPPLDFQCIEGHKADGRTPPGGEKESEKVDPLAEYYAQAKADREAKWCRDASDSEDEDDEFDHRRVPSPRRGFTCDRKGQQPTACANQHIVDKLEELMELHKAKSSEEDRWRAFSYGKCTRALRNYPKAIKSFSEARSIRGVGEKTAMKIMEIINTGDLRRIKYENTEDVAATRVFQGIYGVGRNTAFAWYASGLRTLDDVRARKGGLELTSAQEIGLRYYDDVNSRMPREEAKELFEMIKPIALAIDDKLFVEIMGSYRRGKADCGDIDILITRPTTDGKTHQGVLHALLQRLHTAGIVTEDLAVPDDFSELELIYRGLCKLSIPGAKRRRIDFLCVPWTSRGAALLYYTGDDIFNRAMRLKANKHGYSLNQRGLYAGVVRDPHDRQKKTCEGSIVASETEEEIFDILGVPWQEPHERVRG